jgi:DnaK suppressor protein
MVVPYADGPARAVQKGTDGSAWSLPCCLALEPKVTDTTIRDLDLKRMLTTRRDALRDDLHSRLRDGRAARSPDGGDDLEESDAGVQGDIALALLQMRAEMLTGIEAALVRLDAGRYGFCLVCAGDIAEGRLRALPFAVRCQVCEEQRERQDRARRAARRTAGVPMFPDAIGSQGDVIQ